MTLTKLTESMISRLLPTTKLQHVQFLQAQKALMCVSSEAEAYISVSTTDMAHRSAAANVTDEIPPLLTAQNGQVLTTRHS